MSDAYMFMTLAPLALGWILAFFLLRSDKPRLLALITLGTLAVALVLILLGHLEQMERVESARGQSFFNEAWLARAKDNSMRAVVLMLVLGLVPFVLALVGLIRKGGPLLRLSEPAWVANGTWRTRRTFYSLIMTVFICLLAGGVALASEWLYH
jgi:hypothetical protein